MLWTVIDFKVCKMKWVEISFVMRPSPKWMAEPTNLIILVLIFLDHPKVNTCSPGRSYNQLYNIVSTFYHYYVNPTLLWQRDRKMPSDKLEHKWVWWGELPCAQLGVKWLNNACHAITPSQLFTCARTYITSFYIQRKGNNWWLLLVAWIWARSPLNCPWCHPQPKNWWSHKISHILIIIKSRSKI